MGARISIPDPQMDSSKGILLRGSGLSYGRDDLTLHRPTYFLPLEILLSVFSLIPYLRDPLAAGSTKLPWAESIAISQTCSYLRHAAHAFPFLWTVIPMHSVAWAEIALRLSGDRPISLQAFQFQAAPGSLQTTFNPATSRLALDQLSRIQSLVLGHPNKLHLDNESTVFLNERCASPQILEALFVYRVPINKYTLGHAPRLRRLVLTRTHIAANARILSPSITELAFVSSGVTQASGDGNGAFDFALFEEPSPGPAMLQVLHSLSNLRSLVLIDAGAGTPALAEADVATARIKLPCLEYIRIEGVAWWWPFFIKRLDIPPTTRIDVRSCPFPNDRSPFASALPTSTICRVWGAAASFKHAHIVPPFAPLPEEIRNATKCTIVLSGLFSEERGAPPGLTVSLDIAVHPRILDPFPLLDGSAIPCISKLEALEVHYPELGVCFTKTKQGVCFTQPKQAVDEWTRTMRSHPHIQHISAVGAAAESLLEAIAACPEDFARLRTLTLRKADIGGLGYALLLLRHGPLLRVFVRECLPTDDEQIAKLKTLVGNRVEWDVEMSDVAIDPTSIFYKGTPSKGDELFECPKELFLF